MGVSTPVIPPGPMPGRGAFRDLYLTQLKHGTGDDVSDNDVLKAEIRWAIHTIDNHHSFNSNAGISDVFKQCFPDSEIAQKFSMGERKTSYLTTFGIAPYFISRTRLFATQKMNSSYVLI